MSGTLFLSSLRALSNENHNSLSHTNPSNPLRSSFSVVQLDCSSSEAIPADDVAPVGGLKHQEEIRTAIGDFLMEIKISGIENDQEVLEKLQGKQLMLSIRSDSSLMIIHVGEILLMQFDLGDLVWSEIGRPSKIRKTSRKSLWTDSDRALMTMAECQWVHDVSYACWICYSYDDMETDVDGNDHSKVILGLGVSIMVPEKLQVHESEQFYHLVHQRPLLADLMILSSEKQDEFDLLKHSVLPVHTPKEIFDHVDLIQPTALVATLMPFQRRCVAWMLSKEGRVYTPNGTFKAYQPAFNEMSMKYKDTFVWNALGCWTSHQLTESISRSEEGGGAKAILADEMGLGKTIELLALILLNPSDDVEDKKINGDALIRSKATLIVTPDAILGQWASEIQVNAPHLSVYHFKGSTECEMNAAQLANSRDIVLVSYSTLTKEFHFALEDSQRSRRFERQYQRQSCLLKEILWWRVCLDEAQMVQSPVSKVAETAKRIPRINAWAVTGTPVGKKGLDDLFGLFVFLDPFAMSAASPSEGASHLQLKAFWKRLISNKHEWDLFIRFYMHRNMKREVELSLPNQTMHDIWLKFSLVEQHYYDELAEKAQQEFREVTNQSTAMDDRNDARINSEKELNTLNQWTLQLRQACCHPQVGTQNANRLGKDLKTMDEVLYLMHLQSRSDILSCQRQIFNVMVNRAQVKEHRKDFEGAIETYANVLKEASHVIVDLQQEASQAKTAVADDKEDVAKELGALHERQHLQGWIEVKHRMQFFIASCYHSMKDEQKENEFYKAAEDTRQQILGPLIEEVEKGKVTTNDLLDLLYAGYEKKQKDQAIKEKQPEYAVISRKNGFIALNGVMEDIKLVKDTLEDQWDLMNDWRTEIFELLMSALVKSQQAHREDEHVEHEQTEAVDDYTQGLEVQHKLEIYQNAFGELLQDRKRMLLGESTLESTGRNKKMKKFQDVLEEKLYGERQKLNKRLIKHDPSGQHSADESNVSEEPLSLKFALLELKKKMSGGSVKVPIPELELGQMAYKHFNSFVVSNVKQLDDLERERIHFNRLYNLRVEYFRAIQKFSEQVEVLNINDKPDLDKYDADCHKELGILNVKLANLIGKERYLNHLITNHSKSRPPSNESIAEVPEQGEPSLLDEMCIICQEKIVNGCMTVCGHLHCESCTKAWIMKYHKCATCNQSVQPADIHSISFAMRSSQAKKNGGKSNPPEIQKQVDNISKQALTGSFGTKIDMIVKHILHLKQKDPLTKVLVFSMWEQVLMIIKRALAANEIRWTALDASGVKSEHALHFKQDPTLTAFLLNAKSQAAGLTLTAATHVFLVEPLLDRAIEQQAIGRVHRIGQIKETKVYRYMVADTIEEEIYDKLIHSVRGDARGDSIEQPTARRGSAKVGDIHLQVSSMREWLHVG